MTDTANAPERIWAWEYKGNSPWGLKKPDLSVVTNGAEYVLSTHCDELVAAAYVAASEKAWAIAVEMELHAAIGSTTKAKAEAIEGAILSGTPDNARAALTAYGERMKAEGARDAQAKIARLTEALTYYNDQFCEGFCSDVPAGFTNKDMENDCSGCRARAALTRAKEAGYGAE